MLCHHGPPPVLCEALRRVRRPYAYAEVCRCSYYRTFGRVAVFHD